MIALIRLRALVVSAACVGLLLGCGSGNSDAVSTTGVTDSATNDYYLYAGSDAWSLIDGQDRPEVQPPGPPLTWYVEYRQQLDAPVEADRLIVLALYGVSTAELQEVYEAQGMTFEDAGPEVSVATQEGTAATLVSRSAAGGTLTAFSTSVPLDELVAWFDNSAPVGRDEWVTATGAVSDDG